MNRSVCRVMVGFAALAMLGMTATLAGAQTDAVKEKPPLMTQAAGAHPAAFTLNDVMQAPFPFVHVAAPTGRSRGVGIRREGLP